MLPPCPMKHRALALLALIPTVAAANGWRVVPRVDEMSGRTMTTATQLSDDYARNVLDARERVALTIGCSNAGPTVNLLWSEILGRGVVSVEWRGAGDDASQVTQARVDAQDAHFAAMSVRASAAFARSTGRIVVRVHAARRTQDFHVSADGLADALAAVGQTCKSRPD